MTDGLDHSIRARADEYATENLGFLILTANISFWIGFAVGV
jgi:hypothetical protein